MDHDALLTEALALTLVTLTLVTLPLEYNNTIYLTLTMALIVTVTLKPPGLALSLNP